VAAAKYAAKTVALLFDLFPGSRESGSRRETGSCALTDCLALGTIAAITPAISGPAREVIVWRPFAKVLVRRDEHFKLLVDLRDAHAVDRAKPSRRKLWRRQAEWMRQRPPTQLRAVLR
jgi:hypothetical protein